MKSLVDTNATDAQEYSYWHAYYNDKSSRLVTDDWIRKLDDYAHEHWLSLQQDRLKQKSKLSVVRYGRNVK